jgi:hypothetical protein
MHYAWRRQARLKAREAAQKVKLVSDKSTGKRMAGVSSTGDESESFEAGRTPVPKAWKRAATCIKAATTDSEQRTEAERGDNDGTVESYGPGHDLDVYATSGTKSQKTA